MNTYIGVKSSLMLYEDYTGLYLNSVIQLAWILHVITNATIDLDSCIILINAMCACGSRPPSIQHAPY